MARIRREARELNDGGQTRSLLFEFPPETAQVIDKLASSLGYERATVISKALGLLEVWEEARRQGHVVVERAKSGEGQEYEIEIDS